jgi:hypothetical protein
VIYTLHCCVNANAYFFVSIFHAGCRHAEATAANGTISPMSGDTRDIKNCAFNIKAAPYQQIQIICSVILLADPDYYLFVSSLLIDN